MAAQSLEPLPTRATDPKRFGSWVQNACLAHFWSSGQSLSYWREEPLEVDAVSEGSWGPLAVEVKSGPYSSADLKGLLEFTRRYPRFRPLVVCDAGDELVARRLGLAAVSWQAFLESGPPR